jgi:hypothetical protein
MATELTLAEVEKMLLDLQALPVPIRNAISTLATTRYNDNEISSLVRKVRLIRAFDEQYHKVSGQHVGGAPKPKATISRPRAIAPGEIPKFRPEPKKQFDQVVEVLQLGPMRTSEIFARFPFIKVTVLRTILSKILRQGLAVQPKPATYDGRPAIITREKAKILPPLGETIMTLLSISEMQNLIDQIRAKIAHNEENTRSAVLSGDKLLEARLLDENTDLLRDMAMLLGEIFASSTRQEYQIIRKDNGISDKWRMRFQKMFRQDENEPFHKSAIYIAEPGDVATLANFSSPSNDRRKAYCRNRQAGRSPCKAPSVDASPGA